MKADKEFIPVADFISRLSEMKQYILQSQTAQQLVITGAGMYVTMNISKDGLVDSRMLTNLKGRT